MATINIDAKTAGLLAEVLDRLQAIQAGKKVEKKYLPAWMPDGTEVKTVSDVAVVLNTSYQLASLYVLQAKHAPVEAVAEAKALWGHWDTKDVFTGSVAPLQVNITSSGSTIKPVLVPRQVPTTFQSLNLAEQQANIGKFRGRASAALKKRRRKKQMKALRELVELKVRHVHTAAGAEHFKLPIGSPIGKHGFVISGKVQKQDDGVQHVMVKAPDGQQYGLAHDPVHGHFTFHDNPLNADTDGKYYPTLDGAMNALHKLHQTRTLKPGFRPATDEDRKRLVIPPAWTNAQVPIDPKSTEVEVGGYDVAGRYQSRYTAEHNARVAKEKFARVKELLKALPYVDAGLKKDMDKTPEAAALLIIRRMGLRPGSDSPTGGAKQAYGATNMRNKHAKVNGNVTTFTFTGKSGKSLVLKSTDPDIARVVRKHLKSGGPEDRLFDTNENKVATYFKTIVPDPKFKPKDLRTLLGTSMALDLIAKTKEKPANKTQFTRMQNAIVDQVAAVLGNTRTVCKASYINPIAWVSWRKSAGLEDEE